MLKSLHMNPETLWVINLVDKHGINPPTVCNLNEAFIEILGPASGLVKLKSRQGHRQ